MITYGTSILSLIRNLHPTHPHVTQPWYADGASVGAKFEALREHMSDLLVRGLLWGYFLETTIEYWLYPHIMYISWKLTSK